MDEADCCEVRLCSSGGVLLRDSVHPAGPVLFFVPGAWLPLLRVLP
ncbi:DUF397 domain-containing protein [Nocardiopsis sp. HUAS JQ3]|nr:DUF397 domain-containing protein [Nocardiopsis sp. HUAS JQ3]